MQEAGKTVRLVAGMRQVQRLIASGKAACVYIAKDADERLRGTASRAAADAGVEIRQVESMTELGRKCRIAVGCAVAASTKEG